MPQKPPLIPKKKGRPIELAEPLASIAEYLGGIQPMRARLNDVARATIHRWSDKIRAGEPLPPLVALAIQSIQNDIEKEKTECLTPNLIPSPSPKQNAFSGSPTPPSRGQICRDPGPSTSPDSQENARRPKAAHPATAPSSPSALTSTLVHKTPKP